MSGTAFVGLGAMGGGMARQLIAAGEGLALFDVVGERAAAIASADCRVAISPADAAEGADVLFLMVLDGHQVEEALFGDEGAAASLTPDGVVVVTSTVGPEAIRAAAARLAERNLHLIDAPVSGGVVRAQAGDLIVMVAGPGALVARVEKLLDMMSSEIVDCGESPGDAQSLKLVNQLLCGIHTLAAAEALQFAKALGIDPEAAFDALTKGAAQSFMLENRGPLMLSGEFDPPSSALNLFVKDLALVEDAARAQRFPIPLGSLADQIVRMAAGRGFGDEDVAGIVRMYP